MRKFLAKILVFSIVSIMLSTISYAQNLSEDERRALRGEGQDDVADQINSQSGEVRNLKILSEALDDVENCIDLESPNSPDKNKVIVTIEEPFGSPSSRADGFEIRTCYRNSFSFLKRPGEEVIEPKLANDCSTRAAALANDTSFREYSVKYSCQEVQVILSPGGANLVEGYISAIYTWSAGLVGVVAVVIIILSGIQISVSGGDPDAISKGKTRILKSIAGIALLFLSALILYTVNPNFFVQ